MEDKDFQPIDQDITPEEEISEKDFVLTSANESKEQKFQTKPTTFWKDSLKRFSKNKSSVVAAYILGALILLGLLVPVFSPYDVKNGLGDTAFANLEPKLFNNTNGFWDGTTRQEHIAVDTSSDDQKDWLPDDTYFKPSGISNIEYTDVEYTSTATKYGREGYVQIGYYGNFGNNYADLDSRDIESLEADYRFVMDFHHTVTLKQFETVDTNKIKTYENNQELSFVENFEPGEVTLQFVYYDGEDEVDVNLTDTKLIHNIGLTSGEDTGPINISEKIYNATNQYEFDNCFFRIHVTPVEGTLESANVCALVKSLSFEVENTADVNMHVYFSGGVGSNPINGISFTDAMEMVSRTSEIKVLGNNTKNIGYWEVADNTNYCKSIYLGKCRYASFTYDSYSGALGEREFIITHKELEKYKKAKWISYNIDIDVETDAEGNNKHYFVVEDTFELPEIKSDSCPLTYKNPEAKIVFDIDDIMVDQNPVLGDFGYKVNCKIIYYRYLGYSSMPTFLFGTDKTSRDMFKYVFEGLRNSLALGVMTFIICFLFGLAYGAISGYFGGVVDLIMERITDILSGVPWIVVMTLVVLKADSSSFGVFLLALCLTGWIGTAATTRTQFYRFRGREYVLASRTLGASDARLIAKHILPNAMGTIITGAVLMIPSVIFSEATISYLGLGFKNLSSLGVILSDNQSQLTSHPYQLIFPSIVIALLMISFNLFGNGLRDAINPSLKGEEE